MNTGKIFKGFIIGGLAAAAASLLLAPKSGRDLRRDTKNKFDEYINSAKEKRDEYISIAKSRANDIARKSNELNELVRKFASGGYKEPIAAIENEIANLKTAINAALISYKNYSKGNGSTNKMAGDIFTESEPRSLTEFDDESIPKHQSMRRNID
jgi:gas vesicle protein